MRSRDITIGRKAKNNTVDIDLSLEGPAEKISRRHGTVRYYSDLSPWQVQTQNKTNLYLQNAQYRRVLFGGGG